MKAQLKCRKCEYEFELIAQPTNCIACSHYYVDWINFEEWKEWYDSERVAKIPTPRKTRKRRRRRTSSRTRNLGGTKD